MSDEQKPTPVTRAEIYPVISMIFMLIALLFLGRLKQVEEDTLQVIAHFLFFIAAFGSSVAYSVIGIRDRRRAKTIAK